MLVKKVFLWESGESSACRSLNVRVNAEDMAGSTERALNALSLALDGKTGFGASSSTNCVALRRHSTEDWKDTGKCVPDGDLDVLITRTSSSLVVAKTPSRRGRAGMDRRQTSSSARKRVSQQFEKNEYVPFEACSRTPRWPRSTAQDVVLKSGDELDRAKKTTGGGATAQMAERRYHRQQLRRLTEEVREAKIELERAKIAGVVAPEEPPKLTLEDVEARLRKATKRLLGGDETAGEDCEKYSEMLAKHPDHLARLAAERVEWDRAQAEQNREARLLMRGYVPPTPCDKSALLTAGLSEALAKRILKFKALRLVRASKESIAKTHVVGLRGFDLAGLDTVELRAVYASLPDAFENDSQKEKKSWRESVRDRLVAALKKNEQGAKRHSAYDDDKNGPFFDSNGDDEQPAIVKSGLDGQEAEKRQKELEDVAGARRTLQNSTTANILPFTPANKKKQVEQLPTPSALKLDDPRRTMLAAIVGQQEQPAFLAQLVSKQQRENENETPSQTTRRTDNDKPAFLAQLVSKQQQQKKKSETPRTAQEATTLKSKPAFLDQLVAFKAHKPQPPPQETKTSTAELD